MANLYFKSFAEFHFLLEPSPIQQQKFSKSNYLFHFKYSSIFSVCLILHLIFSKSVSGFFLLALLLFSVPVSSISSLSSELSAPLWMGSSDMLMIVIVCNSLWPIQSSIHWKNFEPSLDFVAFMRAGRYFWHLLLIVERTTLASLALVSWIPFTLHFQRLFHLCSRYLSHCKCIFLKRNLTSWTHNKSLQN